MKTIFLGQSLGVRPWEEDGNFNKVSISGEVSQVLLVGADGAMNTAKQLAEDHQCSFIIPQDLGEVMQSSLTFAPGADVKTLRDWERPISVVVHYLIRVGENSVLKNTLSYDNTSNKTRSIMGYDNVYAFLKDIPWDLVEALSSKEGWEMPSWGVAHGKGPSSPEDIKQWVVEFFRILSEENPEMEVSYSVKAEWLPLL